MPSLKKSYRPRRRSQVFRRHSNGTSLPSSLRRELQNIGDEGSDDYSTGSSDGSEVDPPRSRQPQQRQLSRKERRKQMRIQRQQQKHQHQKDRKRQRAGQDYELGAPFQQQQRKKQQEKRQASEHVSPVKTRNARAADNHGEDRSDTDSAYEKYGVSADSGSISAASAALRQQQQEQQGVDRLQWEMQLLEKRLFRRESGEDTDDTRAKRKKKLRDELQQDGFDFELQDILDDILGTGKGHGEASGSEAEGPDDDRTSSGTSNASEEEDYDSNDGAPDSGAESADSISKKLLEASEPKDRGALVSSHVYVAPHRRRQEGSTTHPVSTAVALDAIKVEVVRALNRVSEGNAEPVLRQLLRVIQDNAADLRRQCGSGKRASEMQRAYTVGVRQLLCEQLMQSCIKSRFATNSLIATQTALCCALSQTWDMDLCLDFLGALATCFSASFSKALLQRAQQPGAAVADTPSLITRHATVGVCCLYDFGFVSPGVFVQLVRRVAGLDEGCKRVSQYRNELSDFRVELLLLMLRLGGGKLRQDDAALFTTIWKELQSMAQLQQGGVEPHVFDGSRDAAEGRTAEAGRLRALLLELQDLKAGKQKDRLMLIKASQDAMRRWLSSSAVFGSTLLTAQFQIDGSWAALEKGQRPQLPTAATAAAQFQQRQYLNAESAAAAPDAAIVGAAAIDIQHKAALLRFNTELQRRLFKCLMMANDPDDALQALHNSGYLALKKNIVTQAVAVVMQCCLQEKNYNPFYGLVLSRLCGFCECGAISAGKGTACKCFLLPEKAAARYRRTVQRGLAAQASAAHGFSLRRLLNLAKLTAFLVRLGVADLRVVRFLNFNSAAEGQAPMGLSGKLGIFLREVCIELLCCPTAAASPFPADDNWEETVVGYFKCLGSMTDICEAFITLLQDVVFQTAKAQSSATDDTKTIKKTDADKARLKASVVKSAIRALLNLQQSEA